MKQQRCISHQTISNATMRPTQILQAIAGSIDPVYPALSQDFPQVMSRVQLGRNDDPWVLVQQLLSIINPQPQFLFCYIRSLTIIIKWSYLFHANNLLLTWTILYSGNLTKMRQVCLLKQSKQQTITSQLFYRYLYNLFLHQYFQAFQPHLLLVTNKQVTCFYI